MYELTFSGSLVLAPSSSLGPSEVLSDLFPFPLAVFFSSSAVFFSSFSSFPSFPSLTSSFSSFCSLLLLPLRVSSSGEESFCSLVERDDFRVERAGVSCFIDYED